MTPSGDPAVYPAHAWLAGVVPAETRRFRVTDARLADALRDAGADLVQAEPEIEIVSARELRGDAPIAIVSLNASASGSQRWVRAAKRLVNSMWVRARAMRIRRMIRKRGYTSTFLITWDIVHAFRLPTLAGRRESRTLVERLPQRALVLGRRGDPKPTLLEAAAADASATAGVPVELKPPLMRAGVLVMVGSEAVLRVAVGPGRQEIDRQVAALQALHTADVPASVADRVPRVLARGRSGLADWSLEKRLPGAAPSLPLPEALIDDCVDFLVDLHGVQTDGRGGPSCAELADVLADLSTSESAGALRELGRRLDAELADLSRGFAHADFFRGNLLAEGGKLVGVVDWDGSGPDSLPLLGLLHLRLAAQYDPEDDEWGRTIVDRLLPWAAAGGDEVARDYCRRIGFEPDPKRLRALALAFWLDLLTLHLRLHPIRRDDRRWIDRNIDLVLRSLAAGGEL